LAEKSDKEHRNVLHNVFHHEVTVISAIYQKKAEILRYKRCLLCYSCTFDILSFSFFINANQKVRDPIFIRYGYLALGLVKGRFVALG
jgi:hypothetical protein